MYEALPALSSRDFRLFWFGQMVSLSGTWVQSIAQQWLVLQITGSAFALGLVTTIQFTPMLLLALVGGAIADRVVKRDLLVITQIASGLLALLLGTLVQTGNVRYWHVLTIAAGLGIVNAFYVPARQAFVPEIVEKDALLNAVALNSTIFNAARVIGPALGGLLIASIGLALNFYLNAASYLAVIASLLAISPRRTEASPNRDSIWDTMREGFRYIGNTPVIYTLLLLVGVASLFAYNFTTLLPLFARFILHVGSDGFGFLMASLGLGSLMGAISLAFLKRRDLARYLVYVGAAVFTTMEILLGYSRHFALSIAVLVVIGFFSTLFTTTANTRILTLTPPHLQGRVMSVYSLMFLGLTPFGSLLSGFVAEHFGSPTALIAGAVVTLFVTICVFFYNAPGRARQRHHAGSSP